MEDMTFITVEDHRFKKRQIDIKTIKISKQHYIKHLKTQMTADFNYGENLNWMNFS